MPGSAQVWYGKKVRAFSYSASNLTPNDNYKNGGNKHQAGAFQVIYQTGEKIKPGIFSELRKFRGKYPYFSPDFIHYFRRHFAVDVQYHDRFFPGVDPPHLHSRDIDIRLP